MSAIPRSLLLEERCKGCGCIFARVPNTEIRYDPERCGFCIAQLEPAQAWRDYVGPDPGIEARRLSRLISHELTLSDLGKRGALPEFSASHNGPLWGRPTASLEEKIARANALMTSLRIMRMGNWRPVFPFGGFEA